MSEQINFSESATNITTTTTNDSVSIQRVKLHPITYTYKLMQGHWTRETTYVSEMQRCFIL